MPNHLTDAVSPYLRSHADNPVDWFPWGDAAFAEAERRDVPLLISIGYSTCHWCHVMARESFSDPDIAAVINDGFVAVKVDREEHPDVDASYLAAAGAFTENLGWPLTVFVTPQGRTFYAGTYWPPAPMGAHPAFRQVLESVLEAWRDRRAEVEESAAVVAEAIAHQGVPAAGALPGGAELALAVRHVLEGEDTEFGGFGRAPKFPVAPVLLFLLERGAAGDAEAGALAARTLRRMAGSGLRDPIEGGFFRYATARDWTEPHYERMLYDNALLLQAYARLEQLEPGGGRATAEGVVSFLDAVLSQPGGGFASAQDSESTVDGVRVEGGYYALDAAGRAAQRPPAVDAKVLTGWNGLAIEALATAGFALSRPDWVAAARATADAILARHLAADGTLLRASIGDRVSSAGATLEDYGMLAAGLVTLAAASGEARYAIAARDLVDASLAASAATPSAATPFGVPGGADPVLAARGLALEVDPSEGAYPSGLSAMASASLRLYLLTGHARYREASEHAMELLAPLAVPRPVSFGGALAVMSALAAPVAQLVVVTDDAESAVASVARGWFRSGAVSTVVTRAQAAAFAEAGFELFAGRDREAAYLCESFVCRLPLTDAAELERALRL
ncbi:thioredoxin domain-containing protein [Lacisediminihabitans profunda]|uniref:Thioredoxin domain-containing protein n=1 Tax=Lacisediminihabitans profunda TaxID=2594790 RepID=A0A5C8UTU5_9MICO|nr:thioredoxin domain-containing protein [Lacisediminihabitans profunda]TXN31036.1 thioredoxin domain-containing protein [Lacisediminihabitans profunda]